MTNEIGKAMFSKAGELGVPVGFMCMKVPLFSLENLKLKCHSIFASSLFSKPKLVNVTNIVILPSG